jgi:hypothetical protein
MSLRPLLACVILLCNACLLDDLGEVGPIERPPGADAGAATDDEVPADDTPPDPDSPPVACDDEVTDIGGGEHHPGEPCIECHAREGEGPRFTLSGTVYDGLASTTPVTGATIRVVDADGVEITLISARNGNFYTAQAVAFPVQVQGSRCPDTRAMATPVTQADGDCNMGGCHDADFRVFLQ